MRTFWHPTFSCFYPSSTTSWPPEVYTAAHMKSIIRWHKHTEQSLWVETSFSLMRISTSSWNGADLLHFASSMPVTICWSALIRSPTVATTLSFDFMASQTLRISCASMPIASPNGSVRIAADPTDSATQAKATTTSLHGISSAPTTTTSMHGVSSATTPFVDSSTPPYNVVDFVSAIPLAPSSCRTFS